MKKINLTLVFFCFVCIVQAQVKLPKIFGDNMVLQRDKPIAVWGWAKAKEKVKVQFHNQTQTTVADKSGKWKLTLTPEKAGGPFTLTVTGKNSISLKNILVGEVWICSGQSNMEWPLKSTEHAQDAIAKANYPNIRHIKIPNVIASTPNNDLASGEWEICDPGTAADFTAVGYYFAKKLVEELNVPVGLINATWGGTHVETWTSREAFENDEEFKTLIASLPATSVEDVNKKRKAELMNSVQAVQKDLNVSADEIGEWKLQHYNDAEWAQLQVPALWETQSLPDVDGVIWFRKTITLNPEEAGSEAKLELGMIDDSDEAYVNGIKVGGLEAQYNVFRSYTVPPAVLKSGENSIAVRVVDTGGGGGVYGDPDRVRLVLPNRAISLTGNWRIRIEKLSHLGGVGPNDYPTLLFNAMINPLIPFTIQGAIWYQGESNAGRAYQYRKAFPLMISDWRRRWGQGDFPFYFVQLASFNADGGTSNKGSTWAELRESQSVTLSLPQTGMIITTDIGDETDIHPRNKKDVGVRLAGVALAQTYSKPVVYRGPCYKSFTVKNSQVIIDFLNPGNKLITQNKYGYLYGFEISGEDKKFFPAQAFIQNNKVIVSSEYVPRPVAVRYGWMDNALEANLFNDAGLPAEPFRTDNWPGITDSKKFEGH